MAADDPPDLGHQWASLVTSVAAHRPGGTGSRTDQSGSTTPVTLLTGFLGAGKSTILAGLLADPGSTGIIRAVVNDVGRLPFDPALVDEVASDGPGQGDGPPGRRSRVELTNGCGCCVAGAASELGDRLEEMAPGADLLVLEASGVADPEALAQVVQARPSLRLDRTVAVVDARAVDRLLAMSAAAPILHRQLDTAEAIIISHADGLVADAAQAGIDRLAALAPGAPIVTSTLTDPAHRVLTPCFRTGARPAPAMRAVGDGPVTQSFPSPAATSTAALAAAVERAGPGLLRAKGRLVVDGRPHLLQLTTSGLRLIPDQAGSMGVTVVVADDVALAEVVEAFGAPADPLAPVERHR